MNKKYFIFIFIFGLFTNQKIISNRLLLENDWSLEEYHKYNERLEALHKNKQMENFLAGDSTNSFDVLKYDITLDWYNILYYGANIKSEDKYWNGSVEITLKSNVNSLNAVQLDAVDLEILSVIVDNISVNPVPNIVNNIITIPLNSQLNKSEETIVTVNYRYTKFDNVGFYLYYKGYKSLNTSVNENIAYTVNSPEFARYWFPCNDTPRDKAVLNMNVLVPYGYNVASNGRLIKVDTITPESGNDYSIYHWSDTTPIATFLINAVASKFVEYSEWFSPNPSVSSPDSLEIKNYVWEEDFNGNVYSAKQMLRSTKQILEYFSKLFIDYPFCKYGSVEVFPFIYSAMENQTMTNLTKQLYSVTQTSNTLAHEIAHHWFGNLVSSKNWNDIWFKEGGATWCEALWAFGRFKQNEKAYFNVMQPYAKTYFSYPELFEIPIWGNSPNIFFSVPRVYLTYNKSAWIFHQLHMFIGQEKNLDILRKILTKYAYKNIDAEEFIQIYKDALKDYPLDFDIDKYFNQWLFGAGHPIYDFQALRTLNNNNDSTWKVNVTLTQTQKGEKITEIFETPIWIIFYNGNKEVYKERVFNNKKVQEYNFDNVPNFTNCKVDTTRTLCQNNIINLTGISEQDIGNTILYPNPSVNQNFVFIKFVDDNAIINSEIIVTNSIGTEQICKINKLDNALQIDISNFVNGLYFVRFNNKLLKFNVIK